MVSLWLHPCHGNLIDVLTQALLAALTLLRRGQWSQGQDNVPILIL